MQQHLGTKHKTAGNFHPQHDPGAATASCCSKPLSAVTTSCTTPAAARTFSHPNSVYTGAVYGAAAVYAAPM